MPMRISNFYLLFMFIHFLSACSSDNDNLLPANDASCDADSETLSIDEASARLTGTWSYTNPEGTCTETWNFAEPIAGEIPLVADFYRTEAQEDISGLYALIEAEDGSGLQLLFNFQTDNLMPDCAGDSIDESGSRYASSLAFPTTEQISLTEIAPPYTCKTLTRN